MPTDSRQGPAWTGLDTAGSSGPGPRGALCGGHNEVADCRGESRGTWLASAGDSSRDAQQKADQAAAHARSKWAQMRADARAHATELAKAASV
jgi:hypothetical protein